ncbi:unnamed protein product [Staurois parvus]|uniref:Uncharacterized protein n=1 Tax=Staurois parvus TaxID=386267 RepID=A0ABN9HHL2_9NEOB|nr:unnamed protein product [Staurois parvus]
MGPRTDSSCCCQARNLPWAPLYQASSCCCQVQSVSWDPLRPPIAAVSIANTHSAMCHFEVSSHCWCVQFFDIGCVCLPLLLPPPPHCGSHSGFGP